MFVCVADYTFILCLTSSNGFLSANTYFIAGWQHCNIYGGGLTHLTWTCGMTCSFLTMTSLYALPSDTVALQMILLWCDCKNRAADLDDRRHVWHHGIWLFVVSRKSGVSDCRFSPITGRLFNISLREMLRSCVTSFFYFLFFLSDIPLKFIIRHLSNPNNHTVMQRPRPTM